MKARIPETCVLVLCLGVVLLLPPVALIFDKPIVIFNVPLQAVYIFGIWIALVIATIILSKSLPGSSE